MDTMNALEKAELAARDLMPYLEWQLSPDSPGYHPTFRSAVAAFRGAFAPEVFAPGSSRLEKWHTDRRPAAVSTTTLAAALRPFLDLARIDRGHAPGETIIGVTAPDGEVNVTYGDVYRLADAANANSEPYGYVYRLRYGPDNWSHQLMFSEAINFRQLPAGDVKEVVALYAGSPPEVETALRYAYAAIESLLSQVQQMRGMFKDEDGAIQRAVDDGDAAIEEIAKALAKIA